VNIWEAIFACDDFMIQLYFKHVFTCRSHITVMAPPKKNQIKCWVYRPSKYRPEWAPIGDALNSPVAWRFGKELRI
jgi:hypothetical protein